MKKAIIFDFGGVLMKTVDYAPRHAWDDRLGLAHGRVEQIVHNQKSWVQAQCGEIPPGQYWSDVAEKLNLSDDEVRQLASDFYSGDQLDLTLIDVIHNLRRDGHPVALLSNESPELLDKLRALDIAHLFDPLVVSCDIGVMKPDPRAYRAVLERLAYPAQETIFIDDRIDNIEGAKALGIQTIHYQVGMDLESVLMKIL